MSGLRNILRAIFTLSPSRDQHYLRTWFANMVGLLLWAAILREADLATQILPIILTLSLGFVFWRGETGYYPFRGRHCVHHKVPFYVMLFIQTALGNVLLHLPAPWWYPTPHSEWIILPFVAYGGLSVLRGFRLERNAGQS